MSRPLDEWLDEAEAALDTADAARALEAADEALKLEPQNRDGLCLKATALTELDRLEEADALIDALLERFPKDTQIKLVGANARIRFSGDDRDRVESGLDLLDGLDRARDERVRFEAHLLTGIGLSNLGELEPALNALAAALDLDPDAFDARLEHALALFECGRFEESKRELTALTRDEPDDAAAWHYLGLTAEREGDTEAARRLFEKAQRLDPGQYPLPVRLSDAEFDAAVEAAIEGLPEAARGELGNVNIVVEPIPTPEDLDGGRLSPIMLGIFHGTAVDERMPHVAEHHQTAVIKLFQRNLERFASTREELIEQIGVTLLHEVGHLMGLDEDELYERGLD
ncbi:MAG: metallopeptidase family protein [Archangiaceae bacterium]|nr:metallopeptidase family protein [Archangiaceae bacterium]